MAEVAVDPALAEAGWPRSRHAALERLGAPGAQRHVAEAGPLGLGQLEAVALVVAPAAQEHRLPLARLHLHPEHLLEEAQALVRLGREQLGVADVGHVVDPSLALHARAQAVEVVGQRARLAACARFTRSCSARSRDAASTSSMRSRSTTTAPSASSTTASPGRIVAPPTSTGSSSAPTSVFVGALHADPARPDRHAELAQLLDVAHRGVHEQRRRRRAPSPASPAARRSAPPARAPAWSAPARRRAAPCPSPRGPSGCRPAPQRTVRAGPAAREPGISWWRSRSIRPSRPEAS